ncbi:hypothetical protein DDP54_16170 (plasmid) [Cellulomonas sp. WB94]|nr:hypothetical protein DDP54_16170 [Cellulomonas sp. WB94]
MRTCRPRTHLLDSCARARGHQQTFRDLVGPGGGQRSLPRRCIRCRGCCGSSRGSRRSGWSFTDPVPGSIEAGLARNGVETLHGDARFTGTNRLEINGESHNAKHFLIATGASARALDFPGHDHLIDSTQFLDLEALPSRILFVGGGFISFEFATSQHVPAAQWSSSTEVPRPLRAFDPDLVGILVARSAAAGIEVRRTTTVEAVERTPSGFQVVVKLSQALIVHAQEALRLSLRGAHDVGCHHGSNGRAVEGPTPDRAAPEGAQLVENGADARAGLDDATTRRELRGFRVVHVFDPLSRECRSRSAIHHAGECALDYRRSKGSAEEQGRRTGKLSSSGLGTTVPSGAPPRCGVRMVGRRRG